MARLEYLIFSLSPTHSILQVGRMYLVYYHEQQQTKIHLLRKKRLPRLYSGSAQPDKWNKKRKRLVRKIACENCRKSLH